MLNFDKSTSFFYDFNYINGFRAMKNLWGFAAFLSVIISMGNDFFWSSLSQTRSITGIISTNYSRGDKLGVFIKLPTPNL